MQQFQAPVAGLLATFPMTFVMLAGHGQLPTRERYPLPPREIVDEILWKGGVEDDLPEQFKLVSTYAAHFAYGMLCGALFGVIEKRLPGPPVVRGAGFGLLVWVGSYLALLPTLNILKPATDAPPRRNLLMISAHLVWGAVLALLSQDERRSEPMSSS